MCNREISLFWYRLKIFLFVWVLLIRILYVLLFQHTLNAVPVCTVLYPSGPVIMNYREIPSFQFLASPIANASRSNHFPLVLSITVPLVLGCLWNTPGTLRLQGIAIRLWFALPPYIHIVLLSAVFSEVTFSTRLAQATLLHCTTTLDIPFLFLYTLFFIFKNND